MSSTRSWGESVLKMGCIRKQRVRRARLARRRSAGQPGAGRARGAVAVLVVVAMVALLGAGALAVDMGFMWNVRADLQRAADASALAAAASLAELEDPTGKARAAARDFAARNEVMSQSIQFSAEDVQFGRATLVNGAYDFVPVADTAFPNAVRVRVRATRDFFFGRVFGKDAKTVSAEATALLVPRDIAIVADLSASHNDDSELGSYRDTSINIWDVWDALPGGSDSFPTTWTPESLANVTLDGNNFSPQTAGPAWGFMRELAWGEPNIDATYQPSADAGLINLGRYSGNGWSSPKLQTYLSAKAFENNSTYSPDEVQQILNTGNHGSWSRYRRQVAVALGLARWDSGKPGGAWESIPGASNGDGDNRIDANEIVWVEPYFNEPGGQWLDYISWASSWWSRMSQANPDFRGAFGPKTFVNYLMERRWANNQTPELAATPAQPMQAVKDAVELMVNLVDNFENDDQISLEVYGYTALHRVPLVKRPNLQEVTTGPNGLLNMQAGHLDGWTNMGGGLAMGIETLMNEPARNGAHKMIVLLTDGQANINEAGEYPPSWKHEEAERVRREAREYVLNQAHIAASNNIKIFTVSVGAYADAALMDEVAAIANGEHLAATGNNIEQYAADLQTIFVRLGGKRPVQLIN